MNKSKKVATPMPRPYNPMSMGKDTTGPLRAEPKVYKGGLPKPRPKFNVQTGKYVSE